jgi:large subunit ribosomal protein L18
MSNIKSILNKRLKRQKRVRSKISGTTQRPRITVFRSNKHISLQVIDDITGKTLVSSSDLGKESKFKGTKTEKAKAVAEDLLKKLKAKKVKALVFDRSYYKYHGRVKTVADTLREGGIEL